MNYINDALMLLTGFFLGFGICYRLSKKYFKKKADKTITIEMECNTDQVKKAIAEITVQLKEFGELANKVGIKDPCTISKDDLKTIIEKKNYSGV